MDNSGAQNLKQLERKIRACVQTMFYLFYINYAHTFSNKNFYKCTKTVQIRFKKNIKIFFLLIIFNAKYNNYPIDMTFYNNYPIDMAFYNNYPIDMAFYNNYPIDMAFKNPDQELCRTFLKIFKSSKMNVQGRN